MDELVTIPDFERSWRERTDRAIWEYVAGGAGTHRTIDDNAAAYDRIWLLPRGVRTSTGEPDTSVTLLGRTVSSPVVLAPTSPQRLVHPDAELATARAARARDVLSIVSTDTHHAFPEIAAEAPGLSWFQLYGYRSREDVAATVELAERGGATALVVTVDASYSARRISTRRAGFRLPDDVDYGTLRALGVLDGAAPASGRLDRLPVTWDDLAWIRSLTTLPVLVKGVLRPEDALRCVELGAEGVIVSNHGGRQLDGALPSLVALDRIARVLPRGRTLLVDGGVRSGVDVVKALALGAHAVCVGRPYLWGLGLNGQKGVEQVLDVFDVEVRDALRQLGVSSVSELGGQFVARAPGFLPDESLR
ncbi:4-hydroxymandelate oxidase [Streptoalloteichus tenebrarius]|uniref:4-hydroxymandelate oxidase n=1 Tax=Streptoalloteichus tenebrarius (strain ATCC 17920 / DSM 40477 / JCM 4838 / CBS 697.72 / NBRC 16177 / NCIMB 11028 / NRRL B-12390 / A12253. 1 / ISP 5477) TaxID=1933 RepID=A0ABT1I0E8_STRSD|nr:4-hydroxymandelate oxidase [Streptoalloteichus tenebrarius]BFF04458.1 alpha-hydroxy acid oxidase [Streptoalloteichus tenebrarius]